MANFSQKSHLNRKNICFSLNHCYMDVHARLCCFAKQRTFFASFMNGDCTQAMQQIMAVKMAVMLAVQW